MGPAGPEKAVSDQRVKQRSVRRIVVAALGILVIVGLIIIAYFFMTGLVAGIVCAGCLVALIWMLRSMRKRG